MAASEVATPYASAVVLDTAHAHAYSVIAPLVPATTAYRSVVKAADTDPGVSQVEDLVAALARILAVALTIVGLTGGIQGLIGGLPDLKLGT
ncbi:MAG: hypothetical protein ABI780_07535, partial [Ardenticatenales bacterium]